MSKIEIKPSFEEFKKLAKRGNLIPVTTDVMADQITPVMLLSSQWKKSRHCFLLESVEGGESLGRYSVVSFEPDKILEENHGFAELKLPSGRVLERYQEPVIDVLRKAFKKIKAVEVEGVPRFYGGAVGYSSYEMVHNLERLPRTNPDPLGWSQGTYFFSNDLFVFDNTQQLLKVIVCAQIKNKSDVSKAYQRAKNRILKNLNVLKAAKRTSVRKKGGKGHKIDFSSNMGEGPFKEAVIKAKEYIGRGDIIQVVLSRRNEKKTTASPLDIYRALRVVNPSPYMYLLKIKDRAVIGSSPESLVRLENGKALTRPIAGTRHRGKTAESDLRLEKELLADPKERAEHVMLVDLGRNDLGRVCKPGTVGVPKFMTIERYSHVMHIVSEVTGQLRPGKDAFDLLKAVFPAGTLSGAPKIRAMEIIDELELDQRGPYGGALGYISYSGNMDMAITIRTVLWNKGHVSIQSGAGIVADSDPKKEFEETESKAAGMKQTIFMAETSPLFWE